MISEQYREFVHNKLISIMNEVHKICMENGIEYSLYAGNMLGAVRHKGFIPWDDDFDIFLTRENFDKLINVLPSALSQDLKLIDDLWLKRITFTKPVYYNDVLINGFSVDLFVVDKLPKSELKRKMLLLKLRMYQGMLKNKNLDMKKYSFIEKCLILVTRFLSCFSSYDKIIKKYNKLSKKYQNKPCNEFFVSNDAYRSIARRYDKNLFNEITLMDYENVQYYVFKETDALLKKSFGDNYMTPTPEAKRHFCHLIEL